MIKMRTLDDQSRFRILNAITVLSVLAHLICGVAGLLISEHVFFVSLSIWCLGGLLLAIFHGVPMLGVKNIVILCVISAAASLFFESMGINFGLFFSKYLYTGFIPGPKLFGFDVYSIIGYGIGVYLVWSVALAAVGKFDNEYRKGDVFFIPVIATFLIVAVDYATDPLMATINQAYLWVEPGVYYGIPYQNYLGWYLMAYVLFQCASLVIWRQSRKNTLKPAPEISRKKKFWYYPPIIYGSLFIQMPFYAFINKSAEIVTYSGQTLMTGDIYKGVAIVYVGAILAPTVIILARIFRSKELI